MKLHLLICISLFSLISCDSGKEGFNPRIYKVQRGAVGSSIRFSGRIRSEDSILVRAPFDAHLVDIQISLGEKVDEGQELVTIAKPEDTNRDSELIQKRGLLSQLEYQKDQSSLKLKNSRKELKSSARLLSTGSISPAEHEQLRIAKSLAEKEFEIAKSKISTLLEEIDLLENREENSSKVLISSIRGIVTELWEEESDITPGMNVAKDTVMAVIEKSGKYILKGEVNEPDYIQMEIGQEVDVSLVYVPGRKWKGSIKSLSPTSNRNSHGVGRFSVSVLFDGKNENIKTGLEGFASVSLAKKSDVLRVPRSSLLEKEGSFFVSGPSASGVTQKEVQTGAFGDQYVEIISGLTLDEEIFERYALPN